LLSVVDWLAPPRPMDVLAGAAMIG
jgi:hypothetical protein